MEQEGGCLLSKEAVHARQASVLAGQGGLDVLVGGQLRQVPQGSHGRFAAKHLAGHSLDVAGRHVAWKRPENSVKTVKKADLLCSAHLCHLAKQSGQEPIIPTGRRDIRRLKCNQGF